MGISVGKSGQLNSEPNVVPLCDILLVLLIIFMVVTTFVKTGANVQLPEAKHVADQPENLLLVEVQKTQTGSGHEIFFDNKKFSEGNANLSKLGTKIIDTMEEKGLTERKILLKADLDLEYGIIVDVMNAIRTANIEIIGLATQRKTASVH